jgi:hypothetical protein
MYFCQILHSLLMNLIIGEKQFHPSALVGKRQPEE